MQCYLTPRTQLSEANQCFRNGKFQLALHLYEQLIQVDSGMARSLALNIALAKSKLLIDNQTLNSVDGGTVYLNREQVIGMPLFDNMGLLNLNDLLFEVKNGTWVAIHDDPFFVLDCQSLSQSQFPWFRFKLRLSSDKCQHHVKLYFDFGEGYLETEALAFQIRDQDTFECVFCCERTLHTIRLDPDDRPFKFKIELLEIVGINEDVAKQSMLEALSALQGVGSIDFIDISTLNWQEIISKAEQAHMQPIQFLFRLYKKALGQTGNSGQYDEWIERYELPNIPKPDQVQSALREMNYLPLISVVMPVFNPEKKFLKQCMDSVIAQSYPYWEFCIADDFSTQAHVKELLNEYASKDSRIRVTYRTTNGHISEASNTALASATGQYVILLDHDDLLGKEAMYFIVSSLNEKPWLKIIYSDEDKVDERGNRFQPHFKSDWNPDLFYSQNYVSHLGVYDRQLLQLIGGFRQGVEGSQDQDLLLRCLPYVDDAEIYHIPKVLYHWRAVAGSTALQPGEKSYTTEAGIKALADYFSHHDPLVKVSQGLLENTYKIQWPIPDPAPLVSLLMPTRDKKQITALAVESILQKTTYQHFELLIIDNGSSEPETLVWLDEIQQKEHRVRVLKYDKPFNFSAINNFAVKHARGEILGLINNDVEVIAADWLTEMVMHAVRPDIGCVGAKLYYGNGSIQHAGVVIGIGGVAGHSHKYAPMEASGYFSRLKLVQNMTAVTAACMLVRKEIYDEVGGLDEHNLKIAFNDVDFCLKVSAAGYRNLWTPFAELYHHESISRGLEDTPEKQERFSREVLFMQAKWGEKLQVDQYYNPNLTMDREDFGIKR